RERAQARRARAREACSTGCAEYEARSCSSRLLRVANAIRAETDGLEAARPLRAERDRTGERCVDRGDDALPIIRQHASEREVIRGVVRAKHGTRGPREVDDGPQLPEHLLHARERESLALLES